MYIKKGYGSYFLRSDINWPELPKGLERELALCYKQGQTISKSWSQIQEEATDIRMQILASFN